MKRQCEYCNKTYYHSNNSKFCSNACKRNATHTTIKCKFCGKERSLTPSQLRSSKWTFCSVECYAKQKTLPFCRDEKLIQIALAKTRKSSQAYKFHFIRRGLSSDTAESVALESLCKWLEIPAIKSLQKYIYASLNNALRNQGREYYKRKEVEFLDNIMMINKGEGK